jgi:broad specificity phosphatase PhoE
MSREQTNTIYLVRHGENKANITKEFSYKLVDYPLTAKGVLQAEQTAEYFTDKSIDEIYTSPLKRAWETAHIIAQKLGPGIVTIEEFREVNVGSLEGQPPNAENWAAHNKVVEDWYNGHFTSTFPDGENFLMLLDRMKAGLLAVTHGKTNKKIVIVGHGGIFTAAIRGICRNVDEEEVLPKHMHNCAITEIELTTTEQTVSGEIINWAYHGHLSGEAAELVPAVPQFDIEE